MPIFHDEITITPFTRREPIRMGGRDAIIYDADCYHELLKGTKLSRWDDEDVVDNKTVRVSLSVNFQLKFAKEGPPSPVIPAHEKLTGRYSLIAGNTGFNAANEVCIVSNKSSDYLPDANALQYLLIVMIKENKFIFADNITLRLHKKNSVPEVLQITREVLFAELMQLDFYSNYEARKAAFLAENAEIATAAIYFDRMLNKPTHSLKRKGSPIRENFSDGKNDSPSQKSKVSKSIKFEKLVVTNLFNHPLELATASTTTDVLPEFPTLSSQMGSTSSSSSPAPSSLLNLSVAMSSHSQPLPGLLQALSTSPLAVPGNKRYFSRALSFFPSHSASAASAISPSKETVIRDVMPNLPKPTFGPPR